jgi:hypothetical protein
MMKRLLNIHILPAVGFFLLLFSGCIEDPKIPPGVKGAGKPEFEGGAVSGAVTVSTIEVSARISKANGAEITERGFCYGTEPSPSIENNNDMIRDGNVGIGEYTLIIKGLSDSTVYYIRPFAVNSEGISYGEPDLKETTYSGQASVVTLDTVNTYASKATVEGRINKAGEGEPAICGIYYSTAENLERKDSVETVAPDNNSKIYSCELLRLTPDTEYYYQAYVRNNYGLSVGDIKSFKTKNGKPLLSSVKATTGYTDATLSSTAGDGGDLTVTIIERGFCLREQTADPSTDSMIPSGAGTGYFEKRIEGLKAERKYIVKAYAISAVSDIDLELTEYSKDTIISTRQDKPTVVTDEVADNAVSNGNADITGTILDEGMDAVLEAGICWSPTNPEPDYTDDSYELSSVNERKLTVRLTGLRGGVTYYVRAFARNGQGISYGEARKFTTPSIFSDNLSKFEGNVPLPNSSTYYATNNGTFYLLGGDLGPQFTADLWSYTVSDNSWRQLKSFEGGAAKWQTGVGYGSGAYVFGGVYENPDAAIGLYYYDPSPTNEWKLKNRLPDTLYSAAGCAYSNSILFIGGKKDTVKQSVWAYQRGFDAWEKKSDFPVKQYGGFAVVYDGKIYAGMGKDDADVCNGSLWVSEDGAAGWNLATACTKYHGGILSGVIHSENQCLYVIDEDYYILEYSLVRDEWKEKSRLPADFRNIHCMYEYKGKIYIGFGGSGRNSLIVYDSSWDN